MELHRIGWMPFETFAETLQRNPELHRAVPQTPKVTILYNRQTLLLNDLDGRGPGGRHKDALLSIWGCHRALQASHVPVDLLDVDELRSGAAARYEVLYLPHCYAFDRQAAAAIRRYVEQGGTVWADGLLGWKDEYGNVAAKAPAELTDVFGLQLHDIEPVDRPFSLSDKGDNAGESWRIHVTPLGARSLDACPRWFANGHEEPLRQRCGRLLCNRAVVGLLPPLGTGSQALDFGSGMHREFPVGRATEIRLGTRRISRHDRV